MPRIFSRNSRKGPDEEMTISGFSFGTSSVSDRIMGRMRISLGGSSINGRSNLYSTREDESLDSGSNSAADKSSRRSLKSMTSFAKRRTTTRRSSSVGKLSMPMPGMDSTNVRSGSGSSSNMIDGMMAEMDSTETMALTGRSMGRLSLTRAPSAPALRTSAEADDRFGSSSSSRKAKLSRNKTASMSSRRLKSVGGLDPPPMECSLAQLRQMSELELEKTLDKAGASPDEVDKALDEVAAVDTSIATIAEDQRKNALVMLLINSGKVKLVRADKARRDSTCTLITSNHSVGESINRDSTFDGTDASISSIPYNDETGASVRSELSVASSTRQERRKSKLDKIFELQTENSNVKRENKSLKKTVKKLLEQLTNVTQKEKETAALAEKYKQEIESGVAANAKDENIEENKDAENKKESDDASNTFNRRDSDVSVDKIKQKLKDERQAHQSTEFRLKAEIDLLTREVEGLQKQLAQTLKSIEKKEQSAKDNRDATSKLKRKLSHASSTISKLKNEAEARDKLIESFTKILLQKIGAEEEANGGFDESTVGTERMDLNTLEQSLKTSLAQDV